MSAEDNLSPDQFAKKKRWIPDQNSRHTLKWHINSNHKGAPAQGWGGVGPKEMEEMHAQMHANGAFQETREHEHFTPKQYKK